MSSHQVLRSNEAKQALSLETGHSILLVRGGDSYNNSGAEDLIEKESGIRPVAVFDKFAKNPDLDDVVEGIKLYRKTNPTVVVAVGGGSVMDMAKLIRFFGSIDVSPVDWLDNGAQTLTHQPTIPVYAVPTTSGSGAEATHFAVMYRNGVKYSVAHPSMKPDFALLVPELTMSMTPFQAAVSGLDALFQGIESWWSKNANEESRGFSEKAIRLSLGSVFESVTEATLKSRTAMQDAAYLAGRGIDLAKTTACHALSYILTVKYGLPHGQAVAVTFPYILDYNLTRMPEYEAENLRSLLKIDINDSALYMKQLINSLGIDIKLDVSVNELSTLWANHVNLERLGNNPSELSTGVFRDLALYVTST